MTRTKVKLATNVPCILTLESVTGKESNSQYNGLEFMYSCRKAGEPSLIYLPEDGRNAIARCGAQVGDEIEITKAKASDGSFIYQCRRLSDAHEPEPVAPVTNYARQISQPISQPQTVRMLAPRTQVAPAPSAPIATVHPLQEMMTRCLEVGYHANQNAYLKLRAQGIEIDAPTWEDARATGSTLFIERMKGGR